MTLTVRDLWAHTNNGTVVSDQGIAVTVSGAGSCAMVRVTPVYNKAPYAAQAPSTACSKTDDRSDCAGDV